MKTKFLFISILLNLGLLVAVGVLISNKPGAAVVEPMEQSSPATDVSKLKQPKKTDNTETNAPAQKFDWTMVESDDYRQYIANLRAMGCPEETIRDIIVADVNKLFEARRKEIRAASTNKFEFWKTSSMFGSMLDEEKIKQSQALAQEKRELLKALLGVEPEEKPELTAMNPFEEMFDFLPEGKQAKIVELMQTFQAKAVKSLKGGAPDSHDMKEMQNVQKEMEAEMAKILTPEELENYQLRLSQTAMMMRMQLSSFEPTEQEFREIFKLRKAFDDEHGLMGMALRGNETKTKTAQKELNDQIKMVLGEERYSEYERSQDWSYQGIAKVVERQGLPKESAVKVYDMKKVAEDQAKALRANKSLAEDQRKAALEAIRAETESAMTQVLGADGFKSYKDQPGAYWLKSISPDKKTE